MSSALLPELTFASLLVYSPRGQSAISSVSRRLRDAIKRGDESVITDAARIARENSLLAGFFGDAMLVPCPRSAPLIEPGALWPGRLIASALAQAGLGGPVVLSLERVRAVPKSAFQTPGERPNALTHFETITARGTLAPTSTRIIVVDDFVTKGNTLLAAASRLKAAYPDSALAAFALVRTLGLQPEIDRIVDPCEGTIRAIGGDAVRRP